MALIAASVVLSPVLCAQQEGPVPTTATVHIQSKQQPVVPSMLTLQINGHNAPIESLTPIEPRGVELAILIDDGLRTSVSLQLQDIAKFIQSLPPTVNVLVGYMANGRVLDKAGFLADHTAAAKELRMPMGSPGISASPYLCLSDFVGRWPSQTRSARVVLMITNGVDPYNGSTSVLNQDSPYVENAGKDAQRAGVVVYPLYFGDAGIGGRSANFSGQSYLNQVAQVTGGRSLYEGSFNPVSFAPYLSELRTDLSESYLLAFQAAATHQRNNSLVTIKVKSNVSGVKVRAPDSVHPGMDQ